MAHLLIPLMAELCLGVRERGNRCSFFSGHRLITSGASTSWDTAMSASRAWWDSRHAPSCRQGGGFVSKAEIGQVGEERAEEFCAIAVVGRVFGKIALEHAALRREA